MVNRRTKVGPVGSAIGAVVGLLVGATLGYLLLGWLASVLDLRSSWTNPASWVSATVIFGPLGAALGAVAARRPRFDSDQRRWLLAAVAACAAAGFVTFLAAGTTEAIIVFVWALAIALVVWLIGSRNR